MSQAKYHLPESATPKEKSEMLRRMRADGFVNLSFNCLINDYQRKLLQDLILATISQPTMQNLLTRQPGDTRENMLEEAKILATMLGQISKDEEEQPGCLHGLCL